MSTPQVGDVITTAEELDALPVGSAVLAGGKDVWAHVPADKYSHWLGIELSEDDHYIEPRQRWLRDAASERGVVVLYLPGHPPRPERVVKAEALAVPLDLLRASARFWTKANVSSSDSACWTWAATLDKRGYGRVSFRDRSSVPAHRIAWAIFHGRLPDADKYICHRCDNPPCVNPHHLFEADPATNFEDMLDKGRGTFRRGFCRKGHALTGGNVILRKDGNRRCRTCANEAQSAYYARSASDSACEKCGKVMRARNLGRHMRLHADADRIERGDA